MQARSQVSVAVIKELEALNSLDVDLYKHAQKLFAKQHKQMTKTINIAVRTPFLST